MPSVSALRSVKIVFSSEGANELRLSTNSITQAQKDLSDQSDRTTRTLDTSSRGALSATDRFGRLYNSLDGGSRALRALERDLGTVNRALAADASLLGQAGEAAKLLQRRYDEAIASTARLSSEQRALARDTIAARDAAAAQASAYQNSLNQRVGIRPIGATSSREDDLRSAFADADRRRAANDPLFQAQQAYRTSLAGLRADLASGVLSEDAYTAALGRKKAAFTDQMASLGRVSAAQREATASAAAMAEANDRAARGWAGLSAQGNASLANLDFQRRMSSASAIKTPAQLAAEANERGPARRLRNDEVTNLMYQGGDIAAQLGSGSPLGMIALQQGPQIAQVFAGPGGASLKEAFKQAGEGLTGFLAKIGPVGAGLGGLAIAAGVSAAALLSYRSGQIELERTLAGLGRTSGATTDQINALANAQARVGGISRGTARDVASTLATTGRVDASLLGNALGANTGFSRFLNVDQKEGAGQLAAALSDVSKGATDLSQRYGLLSDAQAESVRRMDAQGDRLGAQRALLAAVRESTRGLAEETRGWSQITDGLANIWDKLGRNVSKGLFGGTMDQELAKAERNLAEIRTNGSRPRTFSDFINITEGGGLDLSRDEKSAQETVDRWRKAVAERDRLIEQAQRAQRSTEAGGLIRSLMPDRAELTSLEDRLTRLRGIVAQPLKFSLDASMFAAAESALDRVAKVTKTMREEMEKYGSAAAAALYRTAEFDNRMVGATPYGRATAVAERRLQDEALRLKIDLNGPNAATINADYAARLNNPSLDANEGKALIAAREAALNAAKERDTLLQTYRLEVGTAGKAEALSLVQRGGAFARAPADIQQQILDATKRFPTVEPGILAGLLERESSFTWTGPTKEKKADGTPASTAWGRGQITDPAAADIRKLPGMEGFDKYNVDTQVMGAAAYLSIRQKRANNDTLKALDGYGTGPGYGLDIYRRAGQLGDVSSLGLAKEHDARQRQLQLERSEMELATQAGGRDTEQVRARVEQMRLLSAAQARGEVVSRDLTAQYGREASERQRIISAGRFLQFSDNDNFARDQLGRSRIDQQAYAAARPFEGTPYEATVRERTKETLELYETKSMLTDSMTSFVTDLRRGGDAAASLSNALGNVADRFLSKALDSIVSSGFDGLMKGGGGGGGIGGFFSSLFGGGGASSAASPTGGVRLFDVGGYTGSGGKYEPAGVVHRGEYVFDASATSRIGVSALEAIRRGLPGYATGGPVGGAPVWMPPPSNVPAPASAGAVTVNVNRAPSDPVVTETTDAQGNRRIDVTFDEMTAAAVGRPGSRTARALAQPRVATR